MLQWESSDAGTSSHGCYNQQLPEVKTGDPVLQPEIVFAGTTWQKSYNHHGPTLEPDGVEIILLGPAKIIAGTGKNFCYYRGQLLRPATGGALFAGIGGANCWNQLLPELQ